MSILIIICNAFSCKKLLFVQQTLSHNLIIHATSAGKGCQFCIMCLFDYQQHRGSLYRAIINTVFIGWSCEQRHRCLRIRGLCDAFGIKLPIAAYCSHSQANGDQEDFEETYAAHPDCFQDTFYNNILTSKNFGKPLGDPPPLPCVQYIDPEVPLIHLPNLGFTWEMLILLWYCWLCMRETGFWSLKFEFCLADSKCCLWSMPQNKNKTHGKNENLVQTQTNNMFLTLTLGLILSRPKIENVPVMPIVRHFFCADANFVQATNFSTKKYYLILWLLGWLPIAEIFHFHMFLKF